jgi:hypothetical protein
MCGVATLRILHLDRKWGRAVRIIAGQKAPIRKHRKLDRLQRWSNEFIKYVFTSVEIETGKVSNVMKVTLRLTTKGKKKLHR